MKKIFEKVKEIGEDKFPEATVKSHLLKLKDEADEAMEDEDIFEFADCLICLINAISKASFSYEDLLTATDIKADKLKNRDWKRNADGTYQHIKK